MITYIPYHNQMPTNIVALRHAAYQPAPADLYDFSNTPDQQALADWRRKKHLSERMPDMTPSDELVKMRANRERTLVRGAHAYAEFDHADPFALNRSLTHVRVGISSMQPKGMDDVGPCMYDCKVSVEEETGKKTFTNVKRP